LDAEGRTPIQLSPEGTVRFHDNRKLLQVRYAQLGTLIGLDLCGRYLVTTDSEAATL